MVEVYDVNAVVKAKEAEAKEHQSECVWVYGIRRTTNSKGRLVACVGKFPFFVPRKLVAQEKNMETPLLNVRCMKFALWNWLLKQEHFDSLGSWWFYKTDRNRTF